MAELGDARQIVLLKSLETQNRFYALVDPKLGWKNADTIPAYPDDIPLGIAYPCLEDGLNDFAVIRTTFETLDLFPDDAELRTEMMAMIEDARGNLLRRLGELRDRINSGQALFLGTDLQEFKESVLSLATRGTLRRQLDQMMKLEVFESVSAAEADRDLRPPEPTYRYELDRERSWDTVAQLPPRRFIATCFEDLLDAVMTDGHYENRYQFDRNVFQKFIALMFVNYATTDPVFYGTAKGDYGVASDKEMQDTPLYRAVGEALRGREREWDPVPLPSAPEPSAPADPAIPVADQRVIAPLTAMAEGLLMLRSVEHPRAGEASCVISRAGEELFACLRGLGVVTPMAEDPFSHLLHAPPPVRDAGRPRARILVAEDNAVNQKFMLRVLEKRGYSVVIAATGQEALEALERERFDMVLMDIQMPEMDGFQATQAIRALESEGRRQKAEGSPDRSKAAGDAGAPSGLPSAFCLLPSGREAERRIPIVAVTAYAFQGFRGLCLEAGMDDYLAKPIHQRELLSIVEKWLAPGAATRARAVASPDADRLIDRARVLDRVDDDIELLRELVEQFLQDYPGQLSTVREAVARGDARAVEHSAHGLKGAVSNFSDGEAFAAALELETLGRDADLARAPEAYFALERALQRLGPALKSLVQEQ